MAFTGFSAEGIDLLVLNRLQNDKAFYEAHKEEIKRLAIEPFYRLCEEMTPVMSAIDPQFVTVPSRMVSRVRRDTRYTKDKTLYRANLWLFFRRARASAYDSVPAYYVEVHPEYWSWGCWGSWGRGDMAAVREMILHEDKRFLEAFDAVSRCQAVSLGGELYKRPKCPDANPAYQDWLNRKELGVSFYEHTDFAPLLDGSFVQPMLAAMQQLAPLYRFLLAAKERADAGAREAIS